MRAGGILLPIYALPSPYGIGTFGNASKHFIDFLCRAGMTYWQILPLSPTSYGDSPYQSFSAFAGNVYFIDPDDLCAAGLLRRDEYQSIDFGTDARRVDYAALYRHRRALLHKAATRFLSAPDADFFSFCNASPWLEDYALFMAIKQTQDGRAWQDWPPPLKFREKARLHAERVRLEESIKIHKALQYLFYLQWRQVRAYANKQGIQIIGDLPIYVAMDSADVWANPQYFQLDAQLQPKAVAGCPPDRFTATGQLWGNPLFDWNAMHRDDYRWWCARMRHAEKLFDITRIDHFRGFSSYYAVPARDKTAEHGSWQRGPGMALFESLRKNVGTPAILAEDLGFITPDVEQLLRECGFPGMKILQFGFDSREDSDHLPHNYPKHCVAYSGTHDNDTLLGWLHTAPAAAVRYATQYLHLTRSEGYVNGMLRGLLASPADIAILQMQDALQLDSSARTNTPGTLGNNWRWRCLATDFTDALAARLHEQLTIYKRIRKDEAHASR